MGHYGYEGFWGWGVGGGRADFISGSGGKAVWVAKRAKILRTLSDKDCADIYAFCKRLAGDS